jgi:hypothetical protein
VQYGGWVTSIQGIKERSLLLLLVLAVKNEGRGWLLEKNVKKKEEEFITNPNMADIKQND